MPKKFPPITALDWSPLHNLKHLKRKEREKLEKEQRDKENSGRQQKFIYIEIAQKYYMDSIMFSVMKIDKPIRI